MSRIKKQTEPALPSGVAEMVSHLARGLRSNLDPAALNLGLLRSRLSTDQSSLEMLDRVEAGLLAVDAMLHLNCTTERPPRPEPIPLARLLEEVFGSLARPLALERTEVVIDVPKTLWITADRVLLRAALVNLTLNALGAMPLGGNLVVTSYVGPRGLELEFADSGSGRADEQECHLEPFSAERDGADGLALAVVYRVAQLHGGSVVVRNCPEGGAAFTLLLPQQERRAAA